VYKYIVLLAERCGTKTSREVVTDLLIVFRLGRSEDDCDHSTVARPYVTLDGHQLKVVISKQQLVIDHQLMTQ